jgi:hypothetical protein
MTFGNLIDVRPFDELYNLASVSIAFLEQHISVVITREGNFKFICCKMKVKTHLAHHAKTPTVQLIKSLQAL